ncbi:zinc finger protein 200-like [Pygocentrus nattereri]|uniref:C2H2-type domain-containing protein n=1 Tax=Pygocentrus nattereri TaxID=42514 RepID=A0A3B4E3Y6_PYGNA|nr:zinc finger protein 200-like [Pygocentrus nattereri]
MADSYFHVQLTAILDVLLKTAAVDICALADSVFTSLQREIERCTCENEELRRQLRSFTAEQNGLSDREAAPLKTEERSSRAAEDGGRKARDRRPQACNVETDAGTVNSGQQLQKQSAASAGVKEEVTEVYVTQSVESRVHDVSSDGVPVADRNAQLSDLSPDLKTESEKSESVFHSSQPDWNDCSITDYEEEREGQQENQNTQIRPYTNSNGEGEERETEKEQLRRETCPPQEPDLHCTFIQIDGTVTTSVPERQTGSTFACDICGKVVLSEQRLRVHVKTHATLRPYTCSQCGKSFTRKATLNFHQNIHRGVKPYACSVCPKSFADPSALRRHKSIHKVVR